jgi:excinuclease ABC subunit C
MSDSAQAGFDGRDYARHLTGKPGVYRMYAADGALLYVGKAQSLKKRVASYFSGKPLTARTALMVSLVARMDATVTRTAGEALILENQLIKSLKPRFNILLRDDKSYPSLLLTREKWPRLAFHRGPRNRPGRYFGPYPGGTAVRETLDRMFKLFALRSCEDSVFRNRSRPCLQYQIGRCSAPCVGYVAADEYARSVERAARFLDGRSEEVATELTAAMEAASAALQFEQAARLRDQIGQIRSIQARQYVEGDFADTDVLACRIGSGQACVLMLSFRNGSNLGTRSYFPQVRGDESPAEVLAAFVSQHYLEHAPPREILLSHPIEEPEDLAAGLSERAGHRIQIKDSVRGDRSQLLAMAGRNAELALGEALRGAMRQQERGEDLQRLLDLPVPPTRIECFDISHTQGEATVASCVVFDANGPVPAQYRRMNIAGVAPGDDYAAMTQAIERRFRRAVEEGVLPDLLLIDGGTGQLASARAALAAAGAEGVLAIGVAKGEERRAGAETLILPDGRELRPGPQSPALQLIQQVRDEAHRFAITGHRGRRQKQRDRSRLQDIEGIGPQRRAALLRHFGGLAGLRQAGVEEISRVPGIRLGLAQKVYAALHGAPETGETSTRD